MEQSGGPAESQHQELTDEQTLKKAQEDSKSKKRHKRT